MASLDELLTMDGVIFACEFTNDGRCIGYKASTDVSRDMADNAAEYGATITMLFNTLASAFSDVSMMRWVPRQNWTYTGGDWTAVVSGNKAVFAQTANADLNQLTQALTAEQFGGRLQQGI